MNIGIAQINPIIGDIPGNKKLILDSYQRLCQSDAEMVIFPELAICGYPPRDLLLHQRFIAQCTEALEEIARATSDTPALIGFPENVYQGKLFNSVAFCHDGQIHHIARKCLLPTYDVFDEDRYFQTSAQPTIVKWQGLRIGITICEDLWNQEGALASRYYTQDPIAFLAQHGVDLVANCSASPWDYRKAPRRNDLLTQAADTCQCPVIYCNQVGGNDELIFDGASTLALPHRGIVEALPSFQSCHQIVNTESSKQAIKPPPPSDPTHYGLPADSTLSLEDLYQALVLGLRDYIHKSGFTQAVLGLSGGIDSALTAVIAVEALGAENVLGISMPSAISSDHSKDDAAALAQNLGIPYQQLPITDMVDAAENTLDPLFKELPRDVTEENLQARSRGVLLMAISNKLGSLLLTTGNKSEMAVGYCTLYGDMCGGLAVIADVPKMIVFALCRYINRQEEIIPSNTLTKPPSAELRPDQKDQDSLPEYSTLDGILQLYVEERLSTADIIAKGYAAETVEDIIRKVDLNEYKRQQAAPVLKITPLAFGTGRRIPIVQKYRS